MPLNPALPQPETIPPVWRERRAPDPVSLVNWPLAHAEPVAWLMLLFACGAISITAWKFQHWSQPTCAAIACCCALWRTFLPVRWEFALGGVSQKFLGFTQRIPWIAIAKFEAQSDGVWLYADRDASPLRGVFIYYRDQKKLILANLEYYLGTWTSSGDTSTAVLQPTRELE